MDASVRQGAVPGTDRETEEKPRTLFVLKHWVQHNLIFVLTVLVPTSLASVYYGLIASDVYVSESRFVVRSPEQKTQTSLVGQFLQGSGFSHSEDDAYSVRDFILSRDALKELDDKLSVRKSYTSPAVDIFDRFGGLRWDHSFERFYLYYGDHVEVDYDPVSSITILIVRAFTAQDAYRINRELLEMSERLVNALNDRSRSDLVRFADRDVQVAAEKVRDASLALLAFRNEHAVFAPDKQADIQLEGVAKLEGDLVTTEAELAQVRRLSPNNPQIIGLESRAQTLRAAISGEASKVTTGHGSLSASASAFERLALESTIADTQLGSALAALETARRDAARQQLYLERLAQPSLPDKALEPRRVRSIVTVLLLGVMLWGVVSLVLAAVREHAD
jgi:capsular polysaccharide transport system permease protein